MIKYFVNNGKPTNGTVALVLGSIMISVALDLAGVINIM